MATVKDNLKTMPKDMAIDQAVSQAINEPRRRALRYDAIFLEVLTISAKNCVAASKFVVLKRYCSQGSIPLFRPKGRGMPPFRTNQGKPAERPFQKTEDGGAEHEFDRIRPGRIRP